jgi:hypothetical protein
MIDTLVEKIFSNDNLLLQLSLSSQQIIKTTATRTHQSKAILHYNNYYNSTTVFLLVETEREGERRISGSGDCQFILRKLDNSIGSNGASIYLIATWQRE